MNNKGIKNPNIRLLINDEPVLSKVSEAVEEGEDLSELLRYMWAVFKVRSDGVGIAANQVGIAKRVFIINTPAVVQVFVNPIIIKASRQMTASHEECLSCPGLKVTVQRHKQVTVTGFDENFDPIKMKLRGIESMVAQHEMYHLNGITLLHLAEPDHV